MDSILARDSIINQDHEKLREFLIWRAYFRDPDYDMRETFSVLDDDFSAKWIIYKIYKVSPHPPKKMLELLGYLRATLVYKKKEFDFIRSYFLIIHKDDYRNFPTADIDEYKRMAGIRDLSYYTFEKMEV